MFSLEVVYFFGATKGPGYLDMTKNDLAVRLKTGTPRLVYVHRFVNSLIEFSNNFQEEKKKLESVGSSVARNTSELAQTVYQKAFRIKVDLSISAPSLIVPQNSQSEHVVHANLGHLEISNSFKTASAISGRKAILDCLNLQLQDVKVSRALLGEDGSIKAECHLLEPSVMQLHLVRNLTPMIMKEKSGVEINGQIVKLVASLGQADMQLVYEILLGNFGEVPQQKKISKTSRKSRSRRSSGQGRMSRGSRSSSVHSRGEVKLSSPVSNKGDVSNASEEPEKLTTLKAAFGIEAVSVQLFSDRIDLTSGLAKRDLNSSLAKFELITMNVATESFSDGSMNFSANMMDCILDDSRKISNGAIVR